MIVMDTLDPLRMLVADSLKRSDAPRFLLSAFLLPPGEHRIEIDLEDVADDAEVWMLVSGSADDRRVRLSYPHSTDPTVWTHYLIDSISLKEAKTLEETLPTQFDIQIELSDLAAGSMAIEDMCDACALPRRSELVGLDAPPPVESAPQFDGTL